MSDKLDDQLHAKIVALCSRGDDLLANDDVASALESYQEAWMLLPEPRFVWEAATFILAGLGDCYFLDSNFERCRAMFNEALKCPGGLGNPFIHLRMGQACYELGDTPRSDDELTRAYMGAGKTIFENDDPKYFNRLKMILRPRPGETEL